MVSQPPRRQGWDSELLSTLTDGEQGISTLGTFLVETGEGAKGSLTHTQGASAFYPWPPRIAP